MDTHLLTQEHTQTNYSQVILGSFFLHMSLNFDLQIGNGEGRGVVVVGDGVGEDREYHISCCSTNEVA